MKVQKFHSIEEMNSAKLPETSLSHFERFVRLCTRYRAISPKHYPRGVFKYRSLEEAQRARTDYTIPTELPSSES